MWRNLKRLDEIIISWVIRELKEKNGRRQGWLMETSWIVNKEKNWLDRKNVISSVHVFKRNIDIRKRLEEKY